MEWEQKISAQKRFQQEEQKRYVRRTRDEVWRFYTDLRQAIFQELTTQGSCSLIEQLYMSSETLKREYPFLVTVAVIQVLESLTDGRKLPEIPGYLTVIRTCNGMVHLDDLRFQKDIMCAMADPEKIVMLIRKEYTDYRNYFRKNAEAAPEGVSSAGKQEPLPAQQNQDWPSPRVAAEEQRILQEASQARETILPEVKQEIRKVLHAADVRADEIRAEAQTQALQIRQNGLNQERQILEQAQVQAAQILAQAKEQAALDAKQESKRILQQELKDYFRQQRQEWEAEAALDNARRVEISSLGAKLKEEACSETTAFGAALNTTVEAMERQLTDYRNQIVTSLTTWRQSLYKMEYASLLEVYSLLGSQVRRFENDAAKAQTADPEELRQMLLKHSSSVGKLYRNMVRAMEAMGLRQYTPQAGDTFDSYYHTADDGEDDDEYMDRTIARCTAPGMERVVNSSESAVLLRATVELEPEEAGRANPTDDFYRSGF